MEHIIRVETERSRINNNMNNENNENSISYNVCYDDLYELTHSDTFPHGTDDKCSICLEDFDFGDNNEVVKTLGCSHYFHENCLKQWLFIKQNCPNCNNNLVVRFIEEAF